jgi:hypothetical protein
MMRPYSMGQICQGSASQRIMPNESEPAEPLYHFNWRGAMMTKSR